MDDVALRIMQHGASGLCCSQIMVALALEDQGEENVPLVRSMAGMCHGMGDCSGPCGVLTGAACALSLYAAKGSAEEQEHERFPLILATFTEWFQETMAAAHGGIMCKDIMGDGTCGNPDKQHCADIMTQGYLKCLEILTDNGIDPSEPKETAEQGF